MCPILVSIGKMEKSLKSDDFMFCHVYKSSEDFKIHLIIDNKVFSCIKNQDPCGNF